MTAPLLQRRCVIGIDAGGTSMRAHLAELETGAVIASAAAASDPDGSAAPLDWLFHLLWQETRAAVEVVAVCAGITKVSRAGVRADWENTLAKLLPAAAATVLPDYAIAFHGALPSGIGITLVAGTGSVAYGENRAGRALRLGGRGWEYGDEGSGAWLTTEAIRRTVRALDGQAKWSPLAAALTEELAEADAGDFAEAARQRSARHGRGFLVPLLLELAASGESEARDLFTGAAGWLALLARSAAEQLNLTGEDPLHIALAGGMWEAGDMIRQPFERLIRRWLPTVCLCEGEGTPLKGAIRVAQRLAARAS